MEEHDDLSLDFDADLGGDFGDLQMDIENPTDDRSPTAVASNKVLDTVVTKVTDSDFLKESVKDALPKDYRTTVEFGEKQLDGLNAAKRNLLNPIQKQMPEFKRNLNKLTPMVDRYLGKNISEKFNNLTASNNRGGAGEQDPVQLEIQGALASVMGGWQQQQESIKSRELVQKMMDDQTDEGRFKLNYDLLASIDLAARKQVSFNETVGVELAKQSLSLDFKKFHVLKSMLELQTTSFGAQISELRNVTKNTGLPELVKQRNSELFTQMIQENWYGRTADNVTDFGRDYFTKWMDNLGGWAANKGQEVAGQMQEIGGLAEMMGDMEADRAEMGGPEESNRDAAIGAVSGILASLGITKAKEAGQGKLKAYLNENEDAKNMAEKLALFNANKVSSVQDFFNDYDGPASGLMEWLQELAPTLGADREGVESSLKDTLTAKAQYDVMTRETIVSIIPDWLSKIHVAIRELGGGDADKETYDIFTRQFTTERETTFKALESLVTKDEKETITDTINSMLEVLGIDNKGELGLEAKTKFRDILVNQARNNPELDLKDLINNADLSPEFNTVLNNALNAENDEFQGNFSNDLGSDSRKARLKLSTLFKKLGGETTDLQERLNVIDKSGNTNLLRNLGLVNANGELDHSKIAETLYRDEDATVASGKGKPRSGAPFTPVSPTSPEDDGPIVVTLDPEALRSSLDSIQDTAGDTFHATFWEEMDARVKTMSGTTAPDYEPVTSRIDTTNSLLHDFLQAYLNSEEGSNFTAKGVMGGLGGMLGGAKDRAMAFGKGYLDLGLGLFDRSRKALFGGLDAAGSMGKGLLNSFKSEPDIYVQGDSMPALTAKGIKHRRYYNYENGNVIGDPITGIDDITGAVYDVESETIVLTEEEYSRGLYIRKNGLFEKISSAAGSALSMITKPYQLAFDVGKSALGKLNDWRKRGMDYFVEKYNQARDLYDVNGEVIVTAKEILSGKLFYMKDGKQVWITSLKDLLDASGAIYTMEGEKPSIVISETVIKQGLRDVKGKVVEFRDFISAAAGKLAGMASSGFNLGKKAFTMPLTLLRKLTGKVSEAFDRRMVKSMFVDLPDNLVFRTQNVHVYADSLDPTGRTQARERDDILNRTSTSATDDTPQTTEDALNGVKDALRENGEAEAKARESLFDKLRKDINPKVKGDSDGDGYRDGGWKERLKSWRERKGAEGDKASSKDDKGKQDKNMTNIISLLSGLVGIVGAGFGFVKNGLGTLLGGSKILKGLKWALPSALAGGGTATATKTAAKVVAKKAGAKAATMAGGVVAGVMGAPVLAIAITIAATAWTAWEVGSGIYGYFDRRSELTHFEMGRFLQYGYYTGSEGSYETNKVALRYFESEMLDKIVTTKAGGGDIPDTPAELWEEYAGDLGGDADNDDERLRFAEWYNRRFKPVLFKWVTELATYKAQEKYEDITLSSIGETLPRELWGDFVDNLFDYYPLSFDPLQIAASASYTMPIQAFRKESRDYFDKHVLKIEDVAMRNHQKASKVKDDKEASGHMSKTEATQWAKNKSRKDVKDRLKGLTTLPKNLNNLPKPPTKLSDDLIATSQDAYSSEVPNVAPPAPEEPTAPPRDIIDERIAKYDDLIEKAAAKHGIDADLIRNVIRKESSGLAKAKSGVGAAGLMQLMPGTAEEVGVTNRFDPAQSIDGGTAYLRKKLNEFDGDHRLALAAYNAGAGNVRKAIRKAGSRDADDVLAALPQVTGRRSKETIDYVNKISKRYNPTPVAAEELGLADGSMDIQVARAVPTVPTPEPLAIPKLNLPAEDKELQAVLAHNTLRVASAAEETARGMQALVEINALQLDELTRIAKAVVDGKVSQPETPDLPVVEPQLASTTQRKSRDLELSIGSPPQHLQRTVS